MARAKTAKAADGLLDSLRSSPATKRLGDEARNLVGAGTDKLTGTLGNGVGNAAKKLTDIGESGSVSLGEGAKRLLSGDGPVKSAVGAATSGIADKAKSVLGKGGGKGGGKNKAMNIEETIDIGVPVSVAYDQWTQFQDFSRFMKGVESVDQKDDTEMAWRGKVFKSTRTWKAKIQEQVPDRRIVWTSEGNKGTTKGVVTFHPLADDLTRVLVALEYHPGGIVEKTGNIWRAAGRRTRLDLKNFRRFVMMQNEPTGSWRGEIHDGDVVKGPDEDDSDQQSQDDERGSDARDDVDDGDDDRDDDADAADDTPRRSRRSRGSASSSQSSGNGSSGSSRSSGNGSSGSGRSSRSRSGRRTTAAKKAPARKQAAKKAPARKQAAKKAPARKQAAKKAPARKQAAKKAPARTAPARKSTARKSTARKSTARKSTARKSTPRGRRST